MKLRQIYAERRERIVEYYKLTNSMEITGRKFGISRERVRQIVTRMGYRKPLKVYFTKEQHLAQKFARKVEKFWNKIDKQECWLWRGFIHRTGYGCLSFNGKHWYAHRLAWILSGRELAKGECLINSCKNKTCCNPDHWFIGTWIESILYRDKKLTRKNLFDSNQTLK